jgi:hypothetical protein
MNAGTEAVLSLADRVRHIRRAIVNARLAANME